MKIYTFLAIAAISLASCDSANTDIDTGDEIVAARIYATIEQNVSSRATNSSWDNNDEIGITMIGPNTTRYSNKKYTYTTENGNGEFTGTTMYFENKTDAVTITAYYPFRGDENVLPGEIKVSTTTNYQTAKEQLKFDFLYAKEENVTGADPTVNLKFSHKMSKLTLTFTNGNDGTDVSLITSYMIEGLAHNGTFNPMTGECKPDSSPEVLTMNPTVTNGSPLPSLLLLPQECQDVKLKIHDSQNQDYICNLNFGESGIQEGNHYQFNITVNKTELSVNNPSIIPWENNVISGSEAISDDTEESDDPEE